MSHENTSLELPERLIRYAMDIAGWQLETVEQEMQRQPDRYAAYADARERMATAEAELISKLGGDEMALEEYNDANKAYAAALAIEMYLHGVMDGGRVYHAFLTGELPRSGSAE